MKKRAYFNKDTQQIGQFTRVQALRLGKAWELVPRMENFMDEAGKHHVRLHFDDFTADIVETDESIEANAPIISEVEVIENGNTSTN